MALSPHDNNRSELLRQLPLKPGWFIGLGIALIILGLIALIYVVGATVASVVYVGILMTIGGVLHLAHAWSSKGWRGFLFWSLSGILYLFAGLIAISNPLVGATVLTLIWRLPDCFRRIPTLDLVSEPGPGWWRLDGFFRPDYTGSRFDHCRRLARQ